MFFKKIFLFFKRIKGVKVLIVVFAVAVFATPIRADSGDTEVTLGFSWRNSDRDLVVIENYIRDGLFPFDLVIKEQYWTDKWGFHYHYKKWAHVDLSKKFSQFHKRASFIFALDFPLYKELTLGFELNAGVTKREIKEIRREIFVTLNWPEDPYNYKRKEEIVRREIVIPIKIFLNVKYKFEQLKDATGFLRPYIGCGGGIITAVNFDDRLIGSQFPQLPDEKIKIKGIGVGMAGIDLWIFKKLAVFGEVRYVKIFAHKDHVEFVTGLRLK